MNKYPRTLSLIGGFFGLALMILFLWAVPLLKQEAWFLPALVAFVVFGVGFLVGSVLREEMQQNKKDSEDKK